MEQILLGKLTTMRWNYMWRAVWISLMLVIGSSQASAKTLLQSLDFKPYIGWEYQYQHIKGNGPWSQFMPSNIQNQAIFLGNRYHKNFGIELAYYHTLKKSEGSAFLQQFGELAASGTDTYVLAQFRNLGFSAEWDVFYPLDPKFDIMALIGLVTMHPNIQIFTAGGTDLATSLATVSGLNKTILRLGVGAEYREKRWGARGKILWDHTEKLVVNTSGVGSFTSITPRAFKQAVMFTAGIFYIF